jgi:glycosyltransferase involved in cell wall biosynthesis
MGTSKVSVIVPVYGVEAQLRRCVDSILAQTHEDLEVVLVDDGSPDGCPAICDAYAAAEERVRVVHRPNGGLSAARNSGLDASTGDIVTFVDSDDWIRPHMIESLSTTMRDTGAAIVIGGALTVDERGREIDRHELPDATYDTQHMMQAWLRFEVRGNACGKLFRRELFDDIRFRDVMPVEDVQLMLHQFGRSERTSLAGGCCDYVYVSRRGSAMRSRVTDVSQRRRLAVCLEIEDFVRAHFPQFEDDARWFLIRRVYVAISQIHYYLQYRELSEVHEELLDLLRRYCAEVDLAAGPLREKEKRRIDMALNRPLLFRANRLLPMVKDTLSR